MDAQCTKNEKNSAITNMGMISCTQLNLKTKIIVGRKIVLRHFYCLTCNYYFEASFISIVVKKKIFNKQ